MRVCVSGAQYSFWRSNQFLFLSLGQVVYIFEETPKSIQDVIGDVYCPGKYCLNREKCKSLDGYVTTPRANNGCDRCGFWLFNHKVPFTLQEHVKTTNQTKHAFSLLERNELVTRQTLFVIVPFQSTIYRKTCVWTTKYKGLLEKCIVPHVETKSVFTFQPRKRL